MAHARKLTALTLGLTAIGTVALAHGPVAPEPVDTAGLPELGEDWLLENPYRAMGEDVFLRAIEIGDSGYNSNCARCHGLGAVSGGLAPDLRFLEAEAYGDEWYVERFRHGYTTNGVTRMPAFGELLGQEAAWAIRTYIETRPDDQQVHELTPGLRDLRDRLATLAENPDAEPLDAIQADLTAMSEQLETLSGSDYVDSVAIRAVRIIDGSPEAYHRAAEIVTIGLPSAE
ncbi:cytochrome c-550 PedF [Rhodobacterales bacterium HKCCE2091]|nr:cytochrome c-550 PedF [Rhodobacterales bacterium HKCCE2091]